MVRRYPTNTNNGRITQKKDWVSGEEVTYAYDTLNRLISAVTTGPEWGQSFAYDGFGNLTAQTVTKGTAPAMTLSISGTTNRITTAGYSYDANGNLTAAPAMTFAYDVENRLAQATHTQNGTEQYAYGWDNRRVWKKPNEHDDFEVYFYGADGKRMGTYGARENTNFVMRSTSVYFAGKLIREGNGAVNEDRLGSAVKHFPYGEEPATTDHDRVKFATYYRDETTTLDYADQRYYLRTIGRFLTADPYYSPEALANPQEWNRYAYVASDPVNNIDPTGEFIVPVFNGLFGWLGRLFGIGAAVARGMPPFGGSVALDPLGFIRAEEWKRDPGKKVREWDLAIAAAIAASQAQEEEEANRRYPHHLLLKEDCYVRGGYGGSVMRRRTYELQDQNSQMMAGAVRVTESNYVVQGNLGAYNSTWSSAIVIDFISKGAGPVTTQYQQFTAQVVRGIDFMATPVAVMVRDPVRRDFGTLGIKMEKDVIFINGDDGKVGGQYRWCP